MRRNIIRIGRCRIKMGWCVSWVLVRMACRAIRLSHIDGRQLRLGTDGLQRLSIKTTVMVRSRGHCMRGNSRAPTPRGLNSHVAADGRDGLSMAGAGKGLEGVGRQLEEGLLALANLVLLSRGVPGFADAYGLLLVDWLSAIVRIVQGLPGFAEPPGVAAVGQAEFTLAVLELLLWRETRFTYAIDLRHCYGFAAVEGVLDRLQGVAELPCVAAIAQAVL